MPMKGWVYIILGLVGGILFPILQNISRVYNEPTAIVVAEAAASGEKENCQKECCKREHGKKGNAPQGCTDGCKDKTCGCTPAHTIGNIQFYTANHPVNFPDRPEFPSGFHSDHLSSGFHFIWLPPKIV